VRVVASAIIIKPRWRSGSHHPRFFNRAILTVLMVMQMQMVLVLAAQQTPSYSLPPTSSFRGSLRQGGRFGRRGQKPLPSAGSERHGFP
jgi:hypothetical protein